MIKSTKIGKALKEKLITLGKVKDKEFKSIETEIFKLKNEHEKKIISLKIVLSNYTGKRQNFTIVFR